MISYLEGKVLEIFTQKIILKTVSGVGYEVFPTANLFSKIIKLNRLEIPVFCVVNRDGNIFLYGFFDWSERNFFEKLLTVSGVGPKMALILMSLSVKTLKEAIKNGEVSVLTQIKGVSTKIAQKIIVELKGKIDLSIENDNTNTHSQEITDTLLSLGYKDILIQDFLQKNKENKNMSSEEVIRLFLKYQ